MPKNLYILDLSANGLGSKSSVELAQILSDLPPVRGIVDLKNNGIEEKSAREQLQIYTANPSIKAQKQEENTENQKQVLIYQAEDGSF